MYHVGSTGASGGAVHFGAVHLAHDETVEGLLMRQNNVLQARRNTVAHVAKAVP